MSDWGMLRTETLRPMVELINLHKRLGGRYVLRGVNLAVQRGETMVIIGRSGSGKSVTLKHIIGLLQPNVGRALVDGADVATMNPAELGEVRKRLGLVFQSGALLNWLSVGENVALPLREHTTHSDDEIREIVREKLELVELAGCEEMVVTDLSGGMRKRVSLARAIAINPEVLLYDEPTTGLDPILANKINESVISMQKKLRVTTIVVTHDMESAYMVGDRIAMLYGGRIIEIGTPEEIQHTANPIVRQFIDGKTVGPIHVESDVAPSKPVWSKEE